MNYYMNSNSIASWQGYIAYYNRLKQSKNGDMDVWR